MLPPWWKPRSGAQPSMAAYVRRKAKALYQGMQGAARHVPHAPVHEALILAPHEARVDEVEP